jgi:Cys-tRNA(Pro)/Cys-tRNA(Cys) deacylase
MKTNNITRYLDQKKIDYSAHEFAAEKFSAIEVAEILNVPQSQVFKTIVIMRSGSGKPILSVVPGNLQVDLKALAKILNEKKLRSASQREAEALTGLQVGGISPLALINKGFQVVVDSSAWDYEKIFISGGQRGFNISLAPDDLFQLTNAKKEKISI